jgi:agmatine/peptidylarginine deiminase
LIAYDETHQRIIEEQLCKHSIKQDNIIFFTIITNDTWVRDFGPIFVTSNHSMAMLNFAFDAWGEKYPHKHDQLFNHTFKQKVCPLTSSIDIDFVLEAGNLDINSQSLLLSSSSCFQRKITKNSVSLETVQTRFQEWFDCNKVLWIHDALLAGDDTNGHIDTLVRFCNDNVLIYIAQGHHSDPNNECLKRVEQQVKTIYKNEPSISEIVPLPCPQPIFNNSHQLPASYANFLITNKYVFVPVFNDHQDDQTLSLMDELFPSREIIDIESNALVQQFGGIHCATMQVPYGILPPDLSISNV